jgi:hypothetical protein
MTRTYQVDDDGGEILFGDGSGDFRSPDHLKTWLLDNSVINNEHLDQPGLSLNDLNMTDTGHAFDCQMSQDLINTETGTINHYRNVDCMTRTQLEEAVILGYYYSKNNDIIIQVEGLGDVPEWQNVATQGIRDSIYAGAMIAAEVLIGTPMVFLLTMMNNSSFVDKETVDPIYSRPVDARNTRFWGITDSKDGTPKVTQWHSSVAKLNGLAQPTISMWRAQKFSDPELFYPELSLWASL